MKLKLKTAQEPLRSLGSPEWSMHYLEKAVYKSILLSSFQDEKELATCPFDKSHNIQPGRLDEHVKGCQLKAAGFHNLSVKVVYPANFQAQILFET